MAAANNRNKETTADVGLVGLVVVVDRGPRVSIL